MAAVFHSIQWNNIWGHSGLRALNFYFYVNTFGERHVSREFEATSLTFRTPEALNTTLFRKSNIDIIIEYSYVRLYLYAIELHCNPMHHHQHSTVTLCSMLNHTTVCGRQWNVAIDAKMTIKIDGKIRESHSILLPSINCKLFNFIQNWFMASWWAYLWMNGCVIW